LKDLPAWLSEQWRAGKGRPVALALLTFFAMLLSFPDVSPLSRARLALFDQYQNLSPRQPQSQPVVIVEIDEATLNALGQWPWPRNYLAALIDAVAALKPAAVGLDIIMPEPDHASPQAIADSRPDLPKNVLDALVNAASNDHLLATSLSSTPTVLGAAGFPFHTAVTLVGLRTNVVEVQGNNPLPWLISYPYVLASLPEFQAAARGQALLSSDPENGVVRRAAVLSELNSTITPGLSLEMLRVAHGVKKMVVEVGAHGVDAVNIGAQRIPLQSNGEAWVHFDRPSRQRSISAVSLFKNEVPPERIAGKMVLIGLTGLGLQDMITTPLGDRRPGVEVHAQLIEGFEDGHFLTRPYWLRWLELCVLMGGGVLLIWAVPSGKPRDASRSGIEQRGNTKITAEPSMTQTQISRERRNWDRSSGIKPKSAALLVVLLFVFLFAIGMALFRWCGLLFDSASLFIGLAMVFGSLLYSAFFESDHQRRNAELALQGQRVKAAQLSGELDAARRIQLGMLPAALTAFPDETRFEIDAILEPARQVGGDLYDFFMMDTRRLFFVIGDVSGKGLPASLFMVVTKALAKSAALRGNYGIGTIISRANMEMARENPEMLFVTAVAGILDVDNGALELVNAGHDTPLHIGTNGHIESVTGEGGPPLCVLEDYTYPVVKLQLAVGDTLFLLTDGVTEAMNGNKELYSMARVSALLKSVSTNHRPAALVAALREDVRTFVGDNEASDDLTLLVLRWLGPGQHDQR
jgi:serine phosphatase RsbU (regulator of sigma subunit)/CHASE2 domain-containing sensor protein